MLFETPEDTYNAYKRFLKKKEYKKAYRCLEKMLHEFPDDTQLLEDIVDLCVFLWEKPEMGRKWLVRLAKSRALCLIICYLVEWKQILKISVRLRNV